MRCPRAVGTAAVLLASLMGLGLAACVGEPRQGGELVVAPGASERLAMAWRFGYAGLEGPQEPASARVLLRLDGIPTGTAARVGDVLLENGRVAFVIAAADGTDRGGVVVDGWSSSARRDGLGALRGMAAGGPVRATSVRVGTDPPTGAAWVDVVGLVDTADGPLEVATRYDAAPGIDGLLVHTSMVAPAALDPGAWAVGDTLEPAPGGAVHAAAASGEAPVALVLIGTSTGYALVALEAPQARTDQAGGALGLPMGSWSGAPGDLLLHSRFFALLDRPDALAVAVVRARAVGRPVGELELSAVEARGLAAGLPAGTRIELAPAGGSDPVLELVVPRPLAPGEPLVVAMPVGSFSARIAGAREASTIVIETGRLARARVRLP